MTVRICNQQGKKYVFADLNSTGICSKIPSKNSVELYTFYLIINKNIDIKTCTHNVPSIKNYQEISIMSRPAPLLSEITVKEDSKSKT